MANNIRKNIDSLAGVYSSYSDGNFNRAVSNTVPPTLVVLGEASLGPTYRPLVFNADTLERALPTFGTSGTMMKLIQEAKSKGLTSLLAMRIGARAPVVLGIGGDGLAFSRTNGYMLQMRVGGLNIGSDFGVAYEHASNRLIVEDKVNGIVVFDNNPSAPIDLGFVYVFGGPDPTASPAPPDVGTISPLTTVALKDLPSVPGNTITSGGVTTNVFMAYFAGANGVDLSRMEIFEGMLKAFYELEGWQYDYIAAPDGATLDAPFVVQPATTAAGVTYPSKNSVGDALGKVYIEEVNGGLEFYWDVDNDGKAEYWSVNDGMTYETQSLGGHTFTSSSFLEPNFAYALAYHCYRATLEDSFVQAGIGVEPPKIGTPLSAWIGKKPTYTTNASGVTTVTANGTGLLGNKYLAGNTGFRSAVPYGGFIATDEPYFDSGVEQTDDFGTPVDIGRHLSIWITPESFSPEQDVNNGTPYVKISPAAYMAFRDSLPVGVSPTNKPYANAGTILTASLLKSQMADLTEMRYTFAKQDQFGVKVVDGPTAALPSSQYTRQGSMETLQIIDQSIRRVMDKYIGRALSGEEEASIETELVNLRNAFVKSKLVKDIQMKFSRTEDERITGDGRIIVAVDLPEEMRRIFLSISLK